MEAILVIILIVGFFFDAERDTIMFRPQQSWFPNSVFWTQKNWAGHPWYMKTIFVWLLDGWHLMKTIYLWCVFGVMSYLFVQLHGLIWWYVFPITLVLWALNGFVFEISYGDKNL